MTGPQTTTVANPGDLLDLVGTHLGPTDWTTLTQERIGLFADATGDHQWIHTDVERATAESPFGGPIAHGYLTLSLVNLFLPELVDGRGVLRGAQRGSRQVRFPSTGTRRVDGAGTGRGASPPKRSRAGSRSWCG